MTIAPLASIGAVAGNELPVEGASERHRSSLLPTRPGPPRHRTGVNSRIAFRSRPAHAAELTDPLLELGRGNRRLGIV